MSPQEPIIINVSNCEKPCSAIVNVSLNSKKVNALLDTGAGVSLTDLGTLEQITPSPKLDKADKILLDASRAKMDTLGTYMTW